MKRIFLLLLLVTASALAKDKTLIVPGQSVGPITPRTTRADLVQYFGAGNLKNTAIYRGEGESVKGTVVFDKDPKRRMEITWTASKRVGDITISGKSSLWHTAEGITLGTTLAELQRLNGKPFKFSGFDWDYGGLIQDWQGGKLETGLKNIWPTLVYASGDDTSEVSGDQEFTSNAVLQKKLHITVGRLRIELNR